MNLPEAVCVAGTPPYQEFSNTLVINSPATPDGQIFYDHSSIAEHLKLRSLLIQGYEAKPYFPEKRPASLITFSNRRLLSKSLCTIFLASIYWHTL